MPLAWNSFATPVAIDEHTYGYNWDPARVTKTDDGGGPLVTLPESYRLGRDRNGKDQWVVVSPGDLPAETGLAKAEFHRPKEGRPEPYVTPDDAGSSWKKPGRSRVRPGRRSATAAW